MREHICGATLDIMGKTVVCKLASGHYEKRGKYHVAQIWLRTRDEDGEPVIIRTIRFIKEVS